MWSSLFKHLPTRYFATSCTIFQSKSFMNYRYLRRSTVLSIYCSSTLTSSMNLLSESISPPFIKSAIDQFRLHCRQLLDEMVDGGFPTTTEISQLKAPPNAHLSLVLVRAAPQAMIVPPSVAQRVLEAVTGKVSAVKVWRRWPAECLGWPLNAFGGR